MRALSGLTPALSRRLQRQLLRHLPPHAARSLRRTLSLGADRSEPADDPREAPADDDAHSREPPETEIDEVPRASASQFCTLPRSRRRSSASRELASPTSPLVDRNCTFKMAAPRDSSGSRPESRGATDRPLLSKYFSERTTSLDDTYASDGGSLVTDPSYIAAYGPPAYADTTGQNFRRHSLRLSGDRPTKRISRFLRSDFFESPPDESVYTKHKKEKELETQKILKEIREKRSRASDGASTTPTDVNDAQSCISEDITRKCMSPTSVLIGKDRSRSTTPFFPSLDNIKENTADSSTILKTKNICNETRDSHIRINNETSSNQETRIVRPKSYPAKSIKTCDTNKTESERKSSREIETENKNTTSTESKLLRPKSYPNNTNLLNKTNSNRTIRKDECKSSTLNENPPPTPEAKTDVEVSFNITLPRKTKPNPTSNSSEVFSQNENLNAREDKTKVENGSSNLVLRKYKVVNSTQREMPSAVDQNIINESIVDSADALRKRNYANSIKNNISSNGFTRDNSMPKDESKEEKKVIKKKVIKKVSSKSKAELGNDKKSNDKKIVAKKHKDKSPEDSKQNNVTKKKSVLQSIGHKLEKLTSSKSNSPEKTCQNSSIKASKKETSKLRTQREHSVPVEPPTESNLIKRAVTVTDVAALENQISTQNKTAVSKVLGLFKKFEPKEKQMKLNSENARNNIEEQNISAEIESDIEKPQRPSSLLLNGVSRKSNKYNKTSSDSCTALPTDNDEKLTKKEETKSIRSTLKLDFSKLPRVKKIVPTNPVIEPQIMDTSMDKGKVGKSETNGDCISEGMAKLDLGDTTSRSRSRSRSIYSNSDVKSDHSAEIKEKNLISPSSLYPIRSHDSTTPEKEDVGDRIRRKSFYSRFNEKKQRRKSNLVGPGALEYDPVARIYSHSTDKYDASPTSPNTYDISPGYSVSSDASPSTDRYRISLADLPRNNLRYDSLNDKVDTYRSLDRSDLRKYSGTRSYLDYDQPSSYGQNRYSRTKSLLETSDGADNLGLSLLKEPHKYNRTNSLYAPGSYATYRPKRTQLNSAIILKESEKEPSPENILEKIRNRKYSIRVTRKSDSDKDSTSRPAGSSQGEGDGAERSEKGD
ncbi:muscle M-line assembly protein unc-89 isoform X3 [Pieris rapae]|nr:muscle M-line assembly protein unc-89 isoform X3 [Pieris rapae]